MRREEDGLPQRSLLADVEEHAERGEPTEAEDDGQERGRAVAQDPVDFALRM